MCVTAGDACVVVVAVWLWSATAVVGCFVLLMFKLNVVFGALHIPYLVLCA